jgi:prepilin-type N-terminal cleavage/methylation domain-containing protein
MTRRGFSLVELLVSIAIVAILLAMLLPTLVHARRLSHQALCANNLRQVSVGWVTYLQDNKDVFPRFGLLPDWNLAGLRSLGPSACRSLRVSGRSTGTLRMMTLGPR